MFDPNTHMTVSDLQGDSLVNPSCFKVHIKCSQTDPSMWGSYLSLYRSAPWPHFMFSDGCSLTWQKLSSSVQSILYGAGHSGSYSGHRFCIEAATTAVVQGVPDHLNSAMAGPKPG